MLLAAGTFASLFVLAFNDMHLLASACFVSAAAKDKASAHSRYVNCIESVTGHKLSCGAF